MRIALVARSLACLSLTARPRGHLAAMISLPELCVFDLDACLWDKEMFQMSDVPEPGDVVRTTHVKTAPGMAGQQNHTYCSPSAGWPRLSDAWASLGPALALREASGVLAGRRLRHLVIDT